MNYSMGLILALATLPEQSQRVCEPKRTPPAPTLDELLDAANARIRELAANFRSKLIDAEATDRFEKELDEQLQEMGRTATQCVYNSLETADVDRLPKHLQFQNTLYTRLNRKTPQNAWTLFGQIKLWRVGYRPTDKSPEPTLFPLAMTLGLVEGASPALAERAALYLAQTGMTQTRTLDRLKDEHGVGWGVKKLRAVTEAVATQMTPHQHDVQVAQLLEWLGQAEASSGRHKPLLCVGRDGITLGLRYEEGHPKEVASTATVSVLDRRAKRLGTVYLAYVPESLQKTMSEALTKLLEEVLRQWKGDALRLGYVTDSGTNETSYYEKTLKGMKHPLTGKVLEWVRVVDYYHLSQRVWTMAEALFGKGQRGTCWAKKMLRWLLTPGGANRVLHSAVAFRDQKGLAGNALAEFTQAYGYIRDRLAYARYAEYRRVGLPCGSGVTEAACKTVFTQRLKLSGMRWKESGAQVVLDLRVLLLSGVWDATHRRVLRGQQQPQVWTQSGFGQKRAS